MLCFFFFQAEDGIRDGRVMEFRRMLFRSEFSQGRELAASLRAKEQHQRVGQPSRRPCRLFGRARLRQMGGQGLADGSRMRSEERRVGKEGRSRWAREREEKKKGNRRGVRS